MKEEPRKQALQRIAKELMDQIPTAEQSRYESCRVCGQFYDTLDFTEVHYHDDAPHHPMKADA
jgi:hypothetical protein